MNSDTAKLTIVEMGKRLISANLTVRTWGNISMRLNDESFAITPSGYSYETLLPDDIVILNINKPETKGVIKPSSERYIHSFLYKADPSINFIIHTHQKFATAVSCINSNIKIDDEKTKKILGSVVPVSQYAESGTKKLASQIIFAVKNTDAKTILMANHGVVSTGSSAEEALSRACTLEDVCKNFLFTQVPALALAYRKYERQTLNPLINFYRSRREGSSCTVYDRTKNILICKMDIKTGNIQEGYFDFASDIHREIYNNYPEINFIEQSDLPAVLYASKKFRTEKYIEAYLDDFAQIAGENILCLPFFESRAKEVTSNIVNALKNKNAVIIAESGGLCCTSEYNDMSALKEILEKNLLAKIFSAKSKNYFPLLTKNAKKLRNGYINSYSKIIHNKNGRY